MTESGIFGVDDDLALVRIVCGNHKRPSRVAAFGKDKSVGEQWSELPYILEDGRWEVSTVYVSDSARRAVDYFSWHELPQDRRMVCQLQCRRCQAAKVVVRHENLVRLLDAVHVSGVTELDLLDLDAMLSRRTE